jgi:hypothetical protein
MVSRKGNIMKNTVTFSDNVQVFNMVVWNFAYRQARKNEYYKHYLDRLRFEKRIKICENIISKVLDVKHRNAIFKERFM